MVGYTPWACAGLAGVALLMVAFELIDLADGTGSPKSAMMYAILAVSFGIMGRLAEHLRCLSEELKVLRQDLNSGAATGSRSIG